MWENGYEKENLRTELRSCRIKTDAYEKNFHNFNIISLLSYLSFGTLAPILLYSKEKTVKNDLVNNDESNKNENEPLVMVLNSNDNTTNEEINLKSYSYKYRNFIFSPRTSFVYESVSALFFIQSLSRCL